MTEPATGRVLRVNVSDGGVPKLPVASARVTSAGVAGDRQNADTVHGGPHRAVSILGIEVIERLRAEGHPIEPGSTGENLTISGFDVSTLEPGTRLAVGHELVLEISAPTNPCRTIRRSFKDGRFGRLSIKVHPNDSRMYARVITPGMVAPDDPIRVAPAVDPAAAEFAIADRFDDAERESSIVLWEAASAAGRTIAILDDGEIAASAAPGLPGPIFNQGLGFAHMPHLVDRALDHFRSHAVTGWVLADGPPWEGAAADATLARWALEAPLESAEADGVVVRELARDEIGPWADVIVAASEMPPDIGQTWRQLERHLALAAHHHRFVAEVDGTPVGAGSLHLHHQLGWLRAGSVLPSHRGRGIQRSLIAERAAHAWRSGADAIGASTLEEGASAANVRRLGFRRVATRRSYPFQPA